MTMKTRLLPRFWAAKPLGLSRAAVTVVLVALRLISAQRRAEPRGGGNRPD